MHVPVGCVSAARCYRMLFDIVKSTPLEGIRVDFYQ
jgi:hypothetical protein